MLTQEMGRWGIDVSQSSPSSAFAEIDFLNESSLVISADSDVSMSLTRSGVSSVNICDFAIDKQHIPADPLNFANDMYFANAAKVLHCTIRMINQTIEQAPRRTSIWTHVTSEVDSAHSMRSDVILVDARLRRSSKDVRPYSETRFFEEHEVLDGSLTATLQSETRFYSPKYEFREPERILLSNNWSIFLSNVSTFGAVDVITTPLSVHGRLLWDPYLASILAEQVKYL
jgi:hypothetical protein